MSPTSSAKYFAILPAAGVGQRMGATIPKSYLEIQGHSIFSITLAKMLATQEITSVVVLVNSAETHWQASPLSRHPRVQIAQGGASRFESVLNGLAQLASIAGDADWVMVHDMARPCVPLADIRRLISELASAEVGGLLASPVRATLKRATSTGPDATVDSLSPTVAKTVSRERLWAALTPQLFRYGALKKAFEAAQSASAEITDESSAIERMGWQSQLIQGSAENIKITYPEDLALAELILTHQLNTTDRAVKDWLLWK